MRLYLKRWEFTPQKPLKRATQRSPEAVRRWLEEEYPRIARRAKREKTHIYWGDETGISNQDQVGRSYAPRGQTPVIRLTAKKISTSMISAVNNKGLMRFMCFKGALNASLFIMFLRRLIKAAEKKVFLIVDNLRVHHAVKVNKWVTAHKDEIEMCIRDRSCRIGARPCAETRHWFRSHSGRARAAGAEPSDPGSRKRSCSSKHR